MPSSLNRYEYACVRRSRGERGSFDDTKPTRRSTFLFSTFSHIRALQRRVRIATYVWRALLKRQRFRSVIRSHRLTLLQPHCEGEKKNQERTQCMYQRKCMWVGRASRHSKRCIHSVTRHAKYVLYYTRRWLSPAVAHLRHRPPEGKRYNVKRAPMKSGDGPRGSLCS